MPPLDRALARDEIDRRLDAHFSKLSAADVFSGVALVARNGVPVFMKAYGMPDREKKIANTIRTRFNIGSINKEFTQTAIRQLVRPDKLSPDDTLGKFFPDYPQVASRNATVQQLLTHRGGVSDLLGPEFSAAPKDPDGEGPKGEPVYCLRVRGTEDLELAFEIVQPDGTPDMLPVALRRAIGLVRLGGDDRSDRDLRLVQGSALDRLLSDKTLRSKMAAALADAEVEDELSPQSNRRSLRAADRSIS